MPARFTTADHRLNSDCNTTENWSGGLAVMSHPCAVRLFATSGVRRTRSISACSFLTISADKPAGPNRPYQVLVSNPGETDSESVGTSGSSDRRFDPVAARARRVFALTCG